MITVIIIRNAYRSVEKSPNAEMTRPNLICTGGYRLLRYQKCRTYVLSASSFVARRIVSPMSLQRWIHWRWGVRIIARYARKHDSVGLAQVQIRISGSTCRIWNATARDDNLRMLPHPLRNHRSCVRAPYSAQLEQINAYAVRGGYPDRDTFNPLTCDGQPLCLE